MVSTVTIMVLLDAAVGPADVELPPVTGDPSVEDGDELEYVPTRESLLKPKEKEGLPLGGPYGKGWYPPG